MSTHLTPDRGGSTPFRHTAARSPWDAMLAPMNETEAGYLRVDLQEALIARLVALPFSWKVGLSMGARRSRRRHWWRWRPPRFDLGTTGGSRCRELRLHSRVTPPALLSPLYCFPPLSYMRLGWHMPILAYGAWGSVWRDGQRYSLCVSGLLAQSPARCCRLFLLGRSAGQ